MPLALTASDAAIITGIAVAIIGAIAAAVVKIAVALKGIKDTQASVAVDMKSLKSATAGIVQEVAIVRHQSDGVLGAALQAKAAAMRTVADRTRGTETGESDAIEADMAQREADAHDAKQIMIQKQADQRADVISLAAAAAATPQVAPTAPAASAEQPPK